MCDAGTIVESVQLALVKPKSSKKAVSLSVKMAKNLRPVLQAVI
jgi:hypothetical protein